METSFFWFGVFSGSFGLRSIVLCKCSGKYIDIYFILKTTFYLIMQPGVSVLGGEHSPFLACSWDGSSLGAVTPLGLRVVLTPLYGS